MNKKYMLIVLVSLAICMPLISQPAMAYRIQKNYVDQIDPIIYGTQCAYNSHEMLAINENYPWFPDWAKFWVRYVHEDFIDDGDIYRVVFHNDDNDEDCRAVVQWLIAGSPIGPYYDFKVPSDKITKKTICAPPSGADALRVDYYDWEGFGDMSPDVFAFIHPQLWVYY
jgi:hypothetical protein